MPKIDKPFITPAWNLPPGVTDMETNKFPNPIERYKHEPDEAVEDDLIYDQVLNRLFLALKLVGEQVAFYRQKQSGELCSCVDKNRQSPVSTCPICRGTRFVGGYDYLGKTLVQFPQTPKTKILTELGIKLQEPMQPWTANFPLLRDHDFLVRKMALPLSGQLRIVDEPVIKGNYSANEDILAHINLLNVYKLSLTTPADKSDYVEGTDFILTGGELVIEESLASPVLNTRKLRILGKKPPIFMGTGVQPLNINAGLSVGMTARVRNGLAWTGDIVYTLSAGTGADIGYFLLTITKTGIDNRVQYPLSSFIIEMSGDRIFWLSTGIHPATGTVYYITYDYVQTYTQRYQIKGVSPVAPQGAVIMQSFDTSIMEPTHPIYSVGSIFDNGLMIDFRNGITKAMVHQLYSQFGLAPGNITDKKFNQEAGYY
jgi:hypothetical protein